VPGILHLTLDTSFQRGVLCTLFLQHSNTNFSMGTTLCSQPCSNGLLCSLSRKLCAICWWILKLIYIQLCKCKYALRGNYYVRQSRRLDLVTTAPRLGRSSGRDDDWGLCLWVAPTEPRLSHDSRLPGEP